MRPKNVKKSTLYVQLSASSRADKLLRPFRLILYDKFHFLTILGAENRHLNMKQLKTSLLKKTNKLIDLAQI